MKKKGFTEEKFIRPTEHPSPEPLKSDRVRSLFLDLPNENESGQGVYPPPPNDSLDIPELSTSANNGEQYSDLTNNRAGFQGSQNRPGDDFPYEPELSQDGTGQGGPGPSGPGQGGPGPSGPGQGGSGSPISISDEGWKTILPAFYKFVFLFAGKKLEKSMALTESECNDLVTATMPMIHKYAIYDFSYGIELTFIMTIGAIFYSKYSVSEGIPMDEKKLDTENPQKQDDIAKGIFSMLDERKDEFSNMECREINDIEFHQAEKLFRSSGNTEEFTMDIAKRLVTVSETLGFKVDQLLKVVEQMGPENLQKIIERNKP